MFSSTNKSAAIVVVTVSIGCIVANIPFTPYIIATLIVSLFYIWMMNQDQKRKPSNALESHYKARARVEKVRKWERKVQDAKRAAYSQQHEKCDTCPHCLGKKVKQEIEEASPKSQDIIANTGETSKDSKPMNQSQEFIESLQSAMQQIQNLDGGKFVKKHGLTDQLKLAAKRIQEMQAAKIKREVLGLH